MIEVLDSATVDEFTSITRYPLVSYFQKFDSFMKNDYKNIIGYYSGNTSTLNTEPFNNLNDLIDQTQDLFAVFSLNKNVLSNYKFWILIDNIEQIDTALLMINNASKWLRSTISNGGFNPNPAIEIPFNQGQTLESIERDVLGSSDWDNTWSNLASKNDLREEDYTSQGGFLIKANFDYISNNFKINSIVDNPVGDKVLGIDLDRKIQYDTVNQDLVILAPKDTFYQNASILVNLKQGDNPEFPNQGVNSKLIVGSNINNITYPIIFRQLSALMRADDTIKSFTIIDINRLQDSVNLQFTIESRLGDAQQISLTA